jgi:NAD(P)-dependent dehydrogenase (short-subunit alcohol dehydrogenase family)
MKRLEGRVALITGAASPRGQGAAEARLFAAEGAHVIVSDIDADGGEGTVREIVENEGTADFIKTDVTAEADMARLFDDAEARHGRVSIVFNNAGRMLRGTTDDLSLEAFRSLLELNVLGVFLGCKYGIPALRRNGGGAVVNTASAVSFIGTPNSVAYCASKGAVLQLTRAVAMDVAKENIRVNAVCPGLVDTNFYAPDYAKGINPEDFRASSGARSPMGRMASADEIAAAVLYLASSESSFCTGTALLVDGGITAQ